MIVCMEWKMEIHPWMGLRTFWFFNKHEQKLHKFRICPEPLKELRRFPEMFEWHPGSDNLRWSVALLSVSKLHNNRWSGVRFLTSAYFIDAVSDRLEMVCLKTFLCDKPCIRCKGGASRFRGSRSWIRLGKWFNFEFSMLITSCTIECMWSALKSLWRCFLKILV